MENKINTAKENWWCIYSNISNRMLYKYTEFQYDNAYWKSVIAVETSIA